MTDMKHEPKQDVTNIWVLQPFKKKALELRLSGNLGTASMGPK